MQRVVNLMRLLKDLPMHLRRLGIRYIGYFITGVLVPKVAYRALYKTTRDRLRWAAWIIVLLGGTLILTILSLLFNLQIAVLSLLALGLAGAAARLIWSLNPKRNMRRQAQALLEEARATYSNGTFTSWAKYPVRSEIRQAIERAREANPNHELVIGRIDQHGRLLGLFGELPGREPVDEADFVDRPGSKLDVVVTADDHVLVRQDFLGDRKRFLRQWYHVVRLYRHANVPTVHHVNEERSRLYVNLIPGRSMSQVLDGAASLPSERDGAASLPSERDGVASLPSERDGAASLPGERKFTRERKFTPAFTLGEGGTALSDEFWQEVEHQLDLIHARGVTNVGVGKGDILVSSDNAPWFVNFDTAVTLRAASGVAFTFMRDQDRVRINQRYGQDLMTESSARAALSTQVTKVHRNQGWYSSVDFGNGLTVGPVWITSHGPGRWEFLNKRVLTPLVADKRVLDLGSNTGVLPMLMLRAGAREVVGVELSPFNVEAARLVHKIYEWRDMRRYKFAIYNCDMLEVLRRDWGQFDVVTAFCSLYYLDATDMAKVVRRVSELAPVMVLQANTRSKPPGRRERASFAFLKNLLEENGFPNVETFAPSGYNRPLLVGRSRGSSC